MASNTFECTVFSELHTWVINSCWHDLLLPGRFFLRWACTIGDNSSRSSMILWNLLVNGLQYTLPWDKLHYDSQTPMIQEPCARDHFDFVTTSITTWSEVLQPKQESDYMPNKWQSEVLHIKWLVLWQMALTSANAHSFSPFIKSITYWSSWYN